jgi:ATP-dependent DNA helicase PIF1
MTQQQAMAIMNAGYSVLLTGAAGSGKTYVLNMFVRHARARGKNVAVTATTGLAATHLNGTTIHAWSGIGIHNELPFGHINKLSKQRYDLIQKADVLVIDEISMLHHFRLDMIDETCRLVRGNNEPFGGIQIILCGDFFQLPPVSRQEESEGKFIVASKVWQGNGFEVCYLHEQHRQKQDQEYTGILNGIRKGYLSRSQLDLLIGRQEIDNLRTEASIRLLTTNLDVDSINSKRLERIDNKSHYFEMVTSGSKKYVEQLKKSCLAQETLELKVGAKVMCIKNSPDKKYYNGSLGTIDGFDKESGYPVIKLIRGNKITVKPETWELIDGDKKRASIVQFPIRLAWAITVHKSQGMTLDNAQIDLSRAFVEGMGYVALSRVRGLESLYLDGINSMALRVSPTAKDIDVLLQEASDTAIYKYSKEINEWQELQNNSESEILVDAIAKPKTSWADKLAKMRAEYPNAYKPWTEKDDKILVQKFSDGLTIEQLSKDLGRHKGSIKARLEKHLGEDIFD